MDKTFTPAEIADGIISDFGGDVERVRQFYLAAIRLRGSSTQVDQVLDKIDHWLIENRWIPMLRPILDRLAEEGYGDEY